MTSFDFDILRAVESRSDRPELKPTTNVAGQAASSVRDYLLFYNRSCVQALMPCGRCRMPLLCGGGCSDMEKSTIGDSQPLLAIG